MTSREALRGQVASWCFPHLRFRGMAEGSVQYLGSDKEAKSLISVWANKGIHAHGLAMDTLSTVNKKQKRSRSLSVSVNDKQYTSAVMYSI